MAGQKTTAPTSPSKTAAPYDPYGKSSYGYVTSNSVNFRETPNGKKMKTLSKYAFAYIIGSKEVNGVTWYYVNQNGTMGWVHGDYFHQLNLTELTSFLNSNEYRQGLANNSGSSEQQRQQGQHLGQHLREAQRRQFRLRYGGEYLLCGGLERGHLEEHRRDHDHQLRAFQSLRHRHPRAFGQRIAVRQRGADGDLRHRHDDPHYL